MENSSNINEDLKMRYLIFVLSLVALCIPFHFYGQATTVNPLNTDFGSPPEFLGWDNTVNSDLQIRHNEPGQPIIFRIAGAEWMRYTEDGSLAVNTPTSQGARPFLCT